MKSGQRKWLGIALSFVLLLLILIFRDFFLTTVIQPLAILIWALFRLLASVHQRIYWTILILVSFLLVIRNLPADRNSHIRYEESASLPAIEGYDHWITLIRQSLTLTGDRKLMRTRLTQILISAISTSEHRDIGIVQNEFFNRELDIPRTIYDFLLDDSIRHHQPVTKFKIQLFALLPDWLKKKIKTDSQPAQKTIDQTITWIEKISEINYE